MIDKNKIKITFFLSVILGGIIGIVALFPALIWIAALSLMFIIGPLVIIWFQKLNLTDMSNTEHNVTISAISGVFSVIGFCVTYLPVALILNLAFKIDTFLWVKVIFNNFGFIFPMLFFTALLSGLLNSFSGFLTVYFYSILFSNRRN